MVYIKIGFKAYDTGHAYEYSVLNTTNDPR